MDANDRFEFAKSIYDYCGEDKISSREELDKLQPGVDFESCYNGSWNCPFLYDTDDGVTYNGKLIFNREELLSMKCKVEEVSDYEDNSFDLTYTDSSSDNESDWMGYTPRNYLITYRHKFPCSCNKCKYSDQWYKIHPKYIHLYAYVTNKDVWNQDEALYGKQDTDNVLFKDKIEFLSNKGDIINVGRLGAHVHLCIPYKESHYLLK